MTAPNSPEPPADRIEYPAAFEAAEAALLSTRRHAVPGGSRSSTDQLPPDTIGFGLSGGGVRSATFSLGVFQSLAKNKLIRQIDFLSTVSGGGYFGAFLNRLFMRIEQPAPPAPSRNRLEQMISRTLNFLGGESRDRRKGRADVIKGVIKGVADVEDLLACERAVPGGGSFNERCLRWLRENGRYLAPRGSGDVLFMFATILRNWFSVQMVLVLTMLSVFLGVQGLRWLIEWGFVEWRAWSLSGIACLALPMGADLLLWSPWVLLAPVILVALIPVAWAYWLPGHERSGGELPAAYAPLFALLAGIAGMVGAARYEEYNLDALYWASVAVFALAVLTLLTWWGCEWKVHNEARRSDAAETDVDQQRRKRQLLTRVVSYGLIGAAGVLLLGLVDTVAGTLYLQLTARSSNLGAWLSALVAGFASLSVLARPLALLSPFSTKTARRVPTTVLLWIGAVVLAGTWLIAIDVAAHAITWRLEAPRSSHPAYASANQPQIFGADRLEISTNEGGARVVVPVTNAPAAGCRDVLAADIKAIQPLPTAAVWFVVAVMTLLFGRMRSFVNFSTIHSFYAARLTRTFLGASNKTRFDDGKGVAENVPGDDCPAGDYWNWPGIVREGETTKPWMNGAPLHILNVTVNETIDGRTKVQNQDRQGLPLAFGPCGFNLGIRNHLLAGGIKPTVFPLAGNAQAGDGPQAFKQLQPSERAEELTLGRWMSISGAAFSAAAGANTSVSMAIIAGLLNVRLGYWWDSGTAGTGSRRHRWFEWALPVQSALWSEMLAQTHGTAGRFWHLTDGGHFENMGGYELIRRRLPIIVIVDGEADPDYTFQGLSDLVRKARIDFNTEIEFLTDEELSAADGPLPGNLGKYFGSLRSLRRGRWSEEAAVKIDGGARRSFAPDRSRASGAHAALARVKFPEHRGNASWLVYVKATLMGDEPEDVVHYHESHPNFPQETTLDQFFDEAQWESYRRLGEHIGNRVLTPALFDRLRELTRPKHDPDLKTQMDQGLQLGG